MRVMSKNSIVDYPVSAQYEVVGSGGSVKEGKGREVRRRKEERKEERQKLGEIKESTMRED
jgi:hypothetical protein